MAKQQIGLKLEPDLVGELDKAAKAEGMTRTEAVEASLRCWIDAVTQCPAGVAVMDALPKAPTPPPPIRKATKRAAPMPKARTLPPAVVKAATPMPRTTTPPPMDRARVHLIDLPVGRERPAYGSMLKGPKPPRR